MNTLVKRGVGGQPHASSRPPLETVVSRYMAIEGQKRKLEKCREEQLSLQQDALIAEIKHPNKSRQYGAQMKLVRAIQETADKCHSILIALRVLRKTSDHALDPVGLQDEYAELTADEPKAPTAPGIFIASELAKNV